MHVCPEEGDVGCPEERCLSSEALVEDAAERVHVSTLIQESPVICSGATYSSVPTISPAALTPDRELMRLVSPKSLRWRSARFRLTMRSGRSRV